jgi:hypothetical protein
VEHRLSLFKNRVLRRMFEPMTDEKRRGWGNLHIEEFHNLYASENIIRRI